MISSAGDKPLSEQATSQLPNMSGALSSWLQKLKFSLVTTTVVNHRTVEEKEDIEFQGVWQPLSLNEVKIKPEHQRQLKWFNLHATVDIKLKIDDVVTYNNQAYRVLSEGLYNDYGYFNYHLVEDFTGNGPYDQPVTP